MADADLNVNDNNNYTSTLFRQSDKTGELLSVLPCFLSLVIKGLVFDYLAASPAPLGFFASF